MRLTEWADLTSRQWEGIVAGGYWFLRRDIQVALGFWGREPDAQRRLNENFVLKREDEARREFTLEAFKAETVAVRAQLADIVDPLARAVLDLHKESESSLGGYECDGCDPGGYAESNAGYPCSTVELIAQRFDVTLPMRWV